MRDSGVMNTRMMEERKEIGRGRAGRLKSEFGKDQRQGVWGGKTSNNSVQNPTLFEMSLHTDNVNI